VLIHDLMHRDYICTQGVKLKINQV